MDQPHVTIPPRSLVMTSRRLAAAGAGLAALGVVSGAFAAHSLKQYLAADALATWSTGAQYHVTQSMAAVLAAVVAQQSAAAPRLALLSSRLLLLGVAMFSGSLYALALGSPRALGMITPLGGLCFITGWSLLALSLLRGGQNQRS